MAFDKTGILHVVTGPVNDFTKARYVFRIRGREIDARADFATLKQTYRQWLAQNIQPQPVKLDPQIQLPEAAGRRYRAYATATVPWNSGRLAAGTRDGLLALVAEDGSVFSLGQAAAYGPVRCLATNAERTGLWGVAGDDEDMGYVFHYDDKTGLKQLGMLNYDSIGFYRTSASNILSSVCLSPDEKILAIGGADRLGTVHMITL
jgi:hypothetical protein